MSNKTNIDTSKILELLVNKGLRSLFNNVRYDIHPNQSVVFSGSPYYDSAMFDIIFCGFRTTLSFVDNSGVLDTSFIVDDTVHMSFNGREFYSINHFINFLDGKLESYSNYANTIGLTTFFI